MEETTLLGRLPEPATADPGKQIDKKKLELEYIVHLFAFLFLYAGLRKLVDLEMFVREVWGFAIYGSKAMIRAEFILLSCAELVVASMLFFSRTRTAGIIASFVLIVTINICFFILQQFAKVIPPYYGGIFPYVNFLTNFILNIVFLFISLRGVLLLSSLQSKNACKPNTRRHPKFKE